MIPCIDDPYRRERARDELPQSGSGKTIMTSEPKFVPEEAVEISPDGTARLRVRMIDSVGYMVGGSSGGNEAEGQAQSRTKLSEALQGDVHKISFAEYEVDRSY